MTDLVFELTNAASAFASVFFMWLFFEIVPNHSGSHEGESIGGEDSNASEPGLSGDSRG